jgi:hypothetical protein
LSGRQKDLYMDTSSRYCQVGRTLYTDTKFQILSGRQKDLYMNTKFQILSGRQKDLYKDTKF